MINFEAFIIEKSTRIIRIDVYNHLLKSNCDVNIPVKVWEDQYKIIRNAYFELTGILAWKE